MSDGFYHHHKSMVKQLIDLNLMLLILVLCNFLTFGQIRLFSPERTVFRSELGSLPVLKYDVAKLETEHQASFLSYLLTTPKIDFINHWSANSKILPRAIKEGIAHQPHLDNKIYLGDHVWLLAQDVLPWYVPLWSSVVCILVICIVVKMFQIVELIIHGILFDLSEDLSSPQTLENRWNRLFAKLDKMSGAIDKRDQEKDKESGAKPVAEIGSREKVD